MIAIKEKQEYQNPTLIQLIISYFKNKKNEKTKEKRGQLSSKEKRYWATDGEDDKEAPLLTKQRNK